MEDKKMERIKGMAEDEIPESWCNRKIAEPPGNNSGVRQGKVTREIVLQRIIERKEQFKGKPISNQKLHNIRRSLLLRKDEFQTIQGIAFKLKKENFGDPLTVDDDDNMTPPIIDTIDDGDGFVAGAAAAATSTGDAGNVPSSVDENPFQNQQMMNDRYCVPGFDRRPRDVTKCSKTPIISDEIITISSDEETDDATTNNYNAVVIKIENNTFNTETTTTNATNDKVRATPHVAATDSPSNNAEQNILSFEERFDIYARANVFEYSDSNQPYFCAPVSTEERDYSMPAIAIAKETTSDMVNTSGIEMIAANYADLDGENVPMDEHALSIENDKIETVTVQQVLVNSGHPQHEAVPESSPAPKVEYFTNENWKQSRVPSQDNATLNPFNQPNSQETELQTMQTIPLQSTSDNHFPKRETFQQNFLDMKNFGSIDTHNINTTTKADGSVKDTPDVENEKVVLMATQMFEVWKREYEESIGTRPHRSRRVVQNPKPYKYSRSSSSESSTSGIDRKRTKMVRDMKSTTFSGGMNRSAADRSSYSTYFSERQIPKNVESSLYLSSPLAQKCVVCHQKYKRTVYHYKTAHENVEVYVSRLSSEMAKIARNGHSNVTRHLKSSLKYLKATCYFCETDKDFSTHYWLHHIRSHTGEYSNECALCGKIVCHNTHCGFTTSKTDDFDLKDNDLHAYICRACNFLQINEKNIHSHLKLQHEFDDTTDRYDKIVLLPAWYETNQRNATGHGCTRKPIPVALYNHGYDVDHMIGNTNLENDVTVVSGDNVVPLSNPIKLELNEVRALMSVADHYKKVVGSNDGNYVRPWIDDDIAKKPIMSIITQFALFKCMHDKCIFSTDSEEQWSAHIIDHLKFIDTLQKQNILTNEIRMEQNKYRECPYCIINRHKDHQITAHIETEHRRSIFQCAFCYYRTIEIENIFSHHNEFHANEPKEVLLCGEQREFEHDHGKDILFEGEQYIEKFKCDDCTEQFTYFDSFYEHLKMFHSGEYTCAYCKITMKCNESSIQDHLKRYGYTEFQCINCKTGFNEVDEIRSHMAKNHPSKFLFVATRYSKHQLIYVGNSCLDTNQFTLFKCSNPEFLNCMDPKMTSYDQHKYQQMHQQESCAKDQINERYNGSIPPISFQNTTDDFFTKYEDYVKLRSQPITCINLQQSEKVYKCITIDAAKKIRNVLQNFSETHLTCECNEKIKISDEIGITPYLEHLNEQEHACCVVYNEKEILEHRLMEHAKEPMTYLQNENTFEMLVHCTLQCNICKEEFETKGLLKKHYTGTHPNIGFNVSVKQNYLVIDSHNPAKPIGTFKIQMNQFSFVTMFYCAFDTQLMGTMDEALQHHYNEHTNLPKQLIRFHVKSVLLFKNQQYPSGIDELIAKIFRMYIFECLYCSLYFESVDSLNAHSEEVHPYVQSNFTVKKIVACAICTLVSTFEGVRQHFKICHGNNIACCPTNALNAKQCGLCNELVPSANDLAVHYQHFHQTGEILSDAVLKWLQVDTVRFDACTFAPACCTEQRFNQLHELVRHTSECRRNFQCEECFDIFATIKGIVVHHRDVHKKEADEIIDNLQNIKYFLKELLSNMRIYFPNGLVTTRKSIDNTNLDSKLQTTLTKILTTDVWPFEAEYIRSFSSNANIDAISK